MRFENDVVAEGLRCLRNAQPRTLGRALDIAGRADELDRIGDSDGRDRRAGASSGLDRARDHR